MSCRVLKLRCIAALDAREHRARDDEQPAQWLLVVRRCLCAPADVAGAAIPFARNHYICPTEVEMSTVWPETPTHRSAQLMIKSDGEGAPIAAAQRHD
jgi:hypothetical protein